MQTFGYWNINQQLVLINNGNINGGGTQRMNSKEEENEYGITIKNYSGDTEERIIYRANL